MSSSAYILLFALLVAVATCADQGNLIAVLGDGDISDFGYNFNLNHGRVTMELALNLSFSHFIPNIPDEATALAVMVNLASSGYKLIVSTTGSFGAAPSLAAALYPNVSFVQIGTTTSPLPNLSTLGGSSADMYYAAGAFCGAITSNNKVGFVHPGISLAFASNLNAFYVGVKSVKSTATVYAIYTNSFTDAERTKGASDILLHDKGVDMLAGQQDSLSLQAKAIDAGLLAVGINGNSMRTVFGEAVGLSVIFDWGTPLTTYAYGALHAPPGSVFKSDINNGFASNLTFLDKPSYRVPSHAWKKVKHAAELLKQPNKPYFCSPLVAEFGLDPVTGCLYNSTLFFSTALSGIDVLGTYYAVPGMRWLAP